MHPQYSGHPRREKRHNWMRRISESVARPEVQLSMGSHAGDEGGLALLKHGARGGVRVLKGPEHFIDIAAFSP